MTSSKASHKTKLRKYYSARLRIWKSYERSEGTPESPYIPPCPPWISFKGIHILQRSHRDEGIGRGQEVDSGSKATEGRAGDGAKIEIIKKREESRWRVWNGASWERIDRGDRDLYIYVFIHMYIWYPRIPPKLFITQPKITCNEPFWGAEALSYRRNSIFQNASFGEDLGARDLTTLDSQTSLWNSIRE